MRHIQHILAVDAVATVGSGEGEATIGAVAHQLGLDHSVASRIVRDTVDSGYLVRVAPEQDRRKVALRLTEPGHELLAGSRAWQRRTFHELTASWNDHDRNQLAAYLQRLATEIGA